MAGHWIVAVLCTNKHLLILDLVVISSIVSLLFRSIVLAVANHSISDDVAVALCGNYTYMVFGRLLNTFHTHSAFDQTWIGNSKI